MTERIVDTTRNKYIQVVLSGCRTSIVGLYYTTEEEKLTWLFEVGQKLPYARIKSIEEREVK